MYNTPNITHVISLMMSKNTERLSMPLFNILDTDKSGGTQSLILIGFHVQVFQRTMKHNHAFILHKSCWIYLSFSVF